MVTSSCWRKISVRGLANAIRSAEYGKITSKLRPISPFSYVGQENTKKTLQDFSQIGTGQLLAIP
jgi:hypothetical protein